MIQAGATDQFEVLFVCTGNICRSPIAEQLFRARTNALGGVLSTSSAGTFANTGQSMTDQAAAISRNYGGDPSRHRASSVTGSRIEAANLIVTMTRKHRADIVSLVPRASRKSFTLRELDRLIGTYRELEPEGWATASAANVEAFDSFVRGLASTRGFSMTRVLPTDDDIVDPYRRNQDVYDEAGRLISNSIASLADAFARFTLRERSGKDGDKTFGPVTRLDQGPFVEKAQGNDD